MANQVKKDLKSKFLERKQEMGIFQISFQGEESIWIGAAPDISTIQNRIVFTLKHSSDNNNELQYAFKNHGEARMKFEILEKMDFEPDANFRRGILKSKISLWAQSKNAKILRI